jgi:hypothetical protein
MRLGLSRPVDDGVRRFAPLLIAWFVAVVAANPASATLIGVKFGTSASTPAPANWNFVSLEDSPVSNLIDESGAPTTVDLIMVSNQPPFQSFFDGTPAIGTVPSHANPLAPFRGNTYQLSATSFTPMLTFTLDQLTPSTPYHVWVFGARFNAVPQEGIKQRITIGGAGAPVVFDQIGVANDLWVNDTVGSNSDLSTFAMPITSTAAGTITITAAGLPYNALGQSLYTVSGIAFEVVPEPSSWLLVTAGLLWLGSAARRMRRGSSLRARALIVT